MPDSFRGKVLARDRSGVGTPLGQGRNDRVGIVTVPGVEMVLYNFTGVHGIDFFGLWKVGLQGAD